MVSDGVVVGVCVEEFFLFSASVSSFIIHHFEFKDSPQASTT